MKKKNILIGFITATILLWSVNTAAQVQVGTFEDFDREFQSMQTTGGTIELIANINIPMVNSDDVAGLSFYSLSSPNLITIKAGTFRITATGPGGETSELSPVLEIGDGVSINGTDGYLLEALGRAKIKVVGGEIKADGAGARALYANQGWVYVEGGYVKASGASGNPGAIWADNNMGVVVTGGILESEGTGTRTIRVFNGTADISGATIIANPAATCFALFSNGTNIMNIGQGLTIEGAGTGIHNAGDNSKVIIGADAALTNNAAVPYASAAGGLIIDLNPAVTMSITETPANLGNDYVFPGFSGEVTLSVNANGNATAPFVKIYYTTDGSEPGSSSEYMNSGGTIVVSAKNTVIKATIGGGGTAGQVFGTSQSWTYSVETESSTELARSAGNWADLKAAWIESQQPGIEKTTITLTNNIDISEDYDLTAVNPVVIDSKSYYIRLDGSAARTVIFGGALEVIGTSNLFTTNGNGLKTITFDGGYYEMTAAGTTYICGFKSLADITVKNGAEFVIKGGRGISLGTNNVTKLTIIDGKITAPASSRAIYIDGTSKVTIDEGTFTMSGNATASRIIHVNTNASADVPHEVYINGGTFNTGRGNIFAFNGEQQHGTCVIRGATINHDGSTAPLFAKNGPGDGTPRPTTGNYGVQKIYDFRAHEVVIPQNKLHSRSDSPGKLFASELLVETANGIDPVDAALSNDPKNYEIWYRVGSNPIVGEGFSLYEGEEIEVNEGQPLHVYTKMGEYTSAEMTVDLLSTPITNISIPSINRAAYIADNTLYLPESGAVQVFNVGGQLLLNVLATDATLDVSSLSKGIYIVKVGAATFKVVK